MGTKTGLELVKNRLIITSLAEDTCRGDSIKKIIGLDVHGQGSVGNAPDETSFLLSMFEIPRILPVEAILM
jgi:hypothetical protein